MSLNSDDAITKPTLQTVLDRMRIWSISVRISGSSNLNSNHRQAYRINETTSPVRRLSPPKTSLPEFAILGNALPFRVQHLLNTLDHQFRLLPLNEVCGFFHNDVLTTRHCCDPFFMFFDPDSSRIRRHAFIFSGA